VPHLDFEHLPRFQAAFAWIPTIVHTIYVELLFQLTLISLFAGSPQKYAFHPQGIVVNS
jgi:hypothetical protein